MEEYRRTGVGGKRIRVFLTIPDALRPRLLNAESISLGEYGVVVLKNVHDPEGERDVLVSPPYFIEVIR